MLGILDDKYLNNRNIKSAGQCYFIQRWAELTDNRTMYSYQYTYHNLLSSLHECADIIDKTLNGTYPNNGHLKTSINEIKRFIENDILFLKYKGSYVNELKKILGNSLKEKHNIKYLKARIEFLSHELDQSYPKWLTKELVHSVRNNNFSDIEDCLKILVSYCIHNNWSLKGLYESYKTIFSATEKNVTITIYNFLNHLYTHEDKYKVFIPLNEKWTDDDIESIKKIFKFDLKDGKDLKTTWDFINTKHHYCVAIVDARDPYSAALKAIERQKKSIELLFFYNKINTGQFVQKTYYVIHESNEFITKAKIEDIYRTHMKVNDSNSIYDYTLSIFEKDQKKFQTVQQQLQNVFTYVNISKTSPYQEEKFLNLWIALESFMNTGQHDCIITHIKEVLPSIMSKRYFYRIIRNLYEDLKRIDISFENIDSDLNSDLAKHEITIKLINVINNSDAFEKLLTETKGYTLMTHRLKQIRNTIYDTKSARSKVKKYINTIEWHVQRMYRLRNDITHDCLVSENDLTPFIEHLHDFLVTTISEVVIMTTENNLVDVNHVYANVTSNISVFVDNSIESKIDIGGIIDCI